VSHAFAVIIESLVAILLTITIGYCFVLNKRLMRLKADEHALKATISELITATEIAERAITGLKLTVRECDQNLGERLRTAERFCADIERQLAAGDQVLDRLVRIVSATRPDVVTPAAAPTPSTLPALAAPAVPVASAAAPVPAPAPVSTPDPRAMVAAAQALAQRTRSRMGGRAA
jgi:hypothetical protein